MAIIMEKSSKIRIIFVDWRVGRIIMFIMITGSVAYGFGSSIMMTILAAIFGAILSASGFYLDYLGDYKRDRESHKFTNPIAKGTISPISMLLIIIVLLSINVIIIILINYFILIPFLSVILIILGLNYGILNTPFLRAFSLGILQGLYVVIGALFAYKFALDVLLVSLFLFFAMTGGRVLGDARDFLFDQKTDTITIPKKYGLKRSSYFLLINEIIAYLFAILSFIFGDFGIGYLVCVILTIILGLPITFIFVRNPTPKNGNLTNMLSFGFLGMLFIIGMITGRF
jgi:4-hydroxybenzoate polyprenyltransferase